MAEHVRLNLHEDVVLFRESVNFTAAQTGFNPRLIEKDYFCTVLLAYLAGRGGLQLVFKGGTCLAKVHAKFYRLSEDIDFAISLPIDASRSQRRQAILPTKQAIADIADFVSAFTCIHPLTGANHSTQYNGMVAYESPTTRQQETVLVEVSVRELLLKPAVEAEVRTLLLAPISGNAAIPVFKAKCIDPIEAMAEKYRAALSRKNVAIRDFYDIDYAVRQLDFNVDAKPLVDMIRQKLNVLGNLPVDVSEARLAVLRSQLDARLKTVLKDADFCEFDLDRAFRSVTEMAERLG